MIEQLVERAGSNPAVLTSLVALSIFYLVKYVFQGKKPFHAPVLYNERTSKDITKLHAMSKEEFRKHKDEPFILKELHGDTIILPTKYIEEIKALPNDVLSFSEETEEVSSQMSARNSPDGSFRCSWASTACSRPKQAAPKRALSSRV